MSPEHALEGLLRAPVQSRSQDSTDRMLDAALAIIAREGMAGLSIAAVSRESGVSNGALYHRFGDRHGLVVAAQDRFLERVESQWRATAEPLWKLQDPQELLSRLVEAWLALFVRYRTLIHAFMITEWNDDDLRRRGARTNKIAAGQIVHLLTERFHCSPEAADTAHRIAFGQAVLSIISSEDESSALAVAPAERLRHLTRALLAVVQPDAVDG
jgi:AcrR family transcriptional regulator